MNIPTLSQAPSPTGQLSSSHCSSLKFAHPNPPLFTKRSKFSPPNPNPIKLTRTKPITIFNAIEPTTSGSSNSTTKPENSISFVGQDDVPLEGVIQFEKPNSNNISQLITKWGRVALLAGGDVLALLLFSSIGRFSHGFDVFDLETFKTADPFIAGWFLSAYFLGGFSEDGRGMNGRSKAVIAAAKSWSLGIPLGIAIRAARIGHIPATSFILVTMGSTAVFLIGWRALLFSLLPTAKDKKDDVYKQGSPFEFLELLTSLVRRW